MASLFNEALKVLLDKHADAILHLGNTGGIRDARAAGELVIGKSITVTIVVSRSPHVL